jgi:hypothetical protein
MTTGKVCHFPGKNKEAAKKRVRADASKCETKTAFSSWLENKASHTGLSQSQIVRDELEKAKSAMADKARMRSAGSIHGLPRKLSARKGFSRS